MAVVHQRPSLVGRRALPGSSFGTNGHRWRKVKYADEWKGGGISRLSTFLSLIGSAPYRGKNKTTGSAGGRLFVVGLSGKIIPSQEKKSKESVRTNRIINLENMLFILSS
jgi:hypothetical protein